MASRQTVLLLQVSRPGRFRERHIPDCRSPIWAKVLAESGAEEEVEVEVKVEAENET